MVEWAGRSRTSSKVRASWTRRMVEFPSERWIGKPYIIKSWRFQVNW
jgi:hypothetical protein